MTALARWCVRHRWLVVLFWAVALVAATAASRAAGTAYSDSVALPRTESSQAIALLEAVSPRVSGDTDQIVVATSGAARITDPAVRSRVQAMLDKVARVPHVSAVSSPYGPQQATRVNRAGTVAFATVTFDRQAQNLSKAVAQDLVATATSAASAQLHVAVSGQLAEQTVRPSFGGTGLGVALAAAVLLLVFGSVFAMALPLVSALASLGTAVGVIGVLSHALKMPDFSTTLVLLLGLGVGVDYALFIVTRHRQGLIAGRDVESSVVTALNTSGRAVLFAGLIVCIAILGMFALGVSLLYGRAVAAALGVAFTMVAALTLLPALLGVIGPRVLSRRQKARLATHGPRVVGTGTTGFWPRWADVVRRRPMLSAGAAVAIIVVVGLPFFSLRLGSSDQGGDPKSATTRQAYDMLAQGFGPGFNGPLELVSVLRTPADAGTLHTVVRAVASQPGVVRVAPTVVVPARDGTRVAMVDVYPASAPQDGATTDLVNRLREGTIPSAVRGSGLRVLVGGPTAVFIDFAGVLSSKLPLFVGLVVFLSFVLLAMVLRSLVIPLVSAAMNILSIGAAFGMVVAVFEWGWLSTVVGVNRTGPVEAFLPVMLFAILFGLSMDYQVFLVTRIHEEWLHTGDNRRAVRNGLAATGKTVTAAALIMILVFGAFILGGLTVIKEFGLGLAGGILVDAVVIRMAVVPSVMLLIGRPNWWFPSWLDRVIPHIGVSRHQPVAPSAAVPADVQPEELTPA